MSSPPNPHTTTRPLNVTTQGNHRIFVGLSWDPNQGKNFSDRLKNIVTGKKNYHDLDLSCFTYDKDLVFIDVISGKIGEIVDNSGFIYHSGDDQEGLGGGDDEQISVELKNIPDHIHHIVFKASIDSGHKFGEVESPEIRLVDAYSDHHFLKSTLSQHDGIKFSSYIFIALSRSNAQTHSWNLQHINHFCNWGDSTSWKKRLIPFLSPNQD